MRISDWSSDVRSSELIAGPVDLAIGERQLGGEARFTRLRLGDCALGGDVVDDARPEGRAGDREGIERLADRNIVVSGQLVSLRVYLGVPLIINLIFLTLFLFPFSYLFSFLLFF